MTSEFEPPNSVCGPDEGGETFDNSCGAAELKTAKAVCAPDEAESGTTLDNNREAGELEVANSLCVPDEDESNAILDNCCGVSALEAANSVCAPAEGGATLDNSRGPVVELVTS